MTTEKRFSDFLAESFAVLRRELPHAYEEMCRRLAPRAVAITVDDDTVCLRFERAAALTVIAHQRPALSVRTTRAAILALVDAQSTLLEAVLAEQLQLRGHPDDVLGFYDGLMAYLHGAVRAPSFPQLLQSYRLNSGAPREEAI
ncbi:MAG: hypothetical protein HY699_12100 [Deltaproteobacteria bacterium]|nr:hypothetical protein [Deltaproteobacteria bacterium]